MSTESANSSVNPKPKYFVIRIGGQIVPLIPIDELPSYIRLEDLPRPFTFGETQGMISLGMEPQSTGLYKVSFAGITPDSSASYPTSPISDGTRVIKNEDISSTVNGNGRGRDNTDDTMSMAGSVMTSRTDRTGMPRYNPITPGTLGQKKYCSHWIRTGECDFTQQGCKFKHEMPDEKTLLEVLGLQVYPRWWRENMGLPVSSRASSRTAPSSHVGTPVQNVSTPPPPMPLFGNAPTQVNTGHFTISNPGDPLRWSKESGLITNNKWQGRRTAVGSQNHSGNQGSRGQPSTSSREYQILPRTTNAGTPTRSGSVHPPSFPTNSSTAHSSPRTAQDVRNRDVRLPGVPSSVYSPNRGPTSVFSSPRSGFNAAAPPFFSRLPNTGSTTYSFGQSPQASPRLGQYSVLKPSPLPATDGRQVNASSTNMRQGPRKLMDGAPPVPFYNHPRRFLAPDAGDFGHRRETAPASETITEGSEVSSSVVTEANMSQRVKDDGASDTLINLKN